MCKNNVNANELFSRREWRDSVSQLKRKSHEKSSSERREKTFCDELNEFSKALIETQSISKGFKTTI